MYIIKVWHKLCVLASEVLVNEVFDRLIKLHHPMQPYKCIHEIVLTHDTENLKVENLVT